MGRTGYNDQQLLAARKRTIFASILIFIIIPATIIGGTFLLDSSNYMLISLMVVIYTIVPFFMIFEKRRPKAREIVLIAMMTAITVAAHMFFHVTVPIQIGTTLVIISGVALGPEAGFLIGALSRFVCNFYMGQGPWTPWQMFCWGLLAFLAGLAFNKITVENRFENISRENKKAAGFRMVAGPVMCIIFAVVAGYITYIIVPGEDGTFLGWRIYAFGAAGLLAGVIIQRKKLNANGLTLALFTFFTTVIIYGGIINIASMFTSAGIPGSDISFNTLRLLYVSGFPFDFWHGLNAAITMFIIGKPMIQKLERIKIKYGIYR